MDKLELVDELRKSFVLVTLTHRAPPRKLDGLDDTLRKQLVEHHEAALGAFTDYSIRFGSRRAVPANAVPELVETAGRSLGAMKALIGQLNDEQRAAFSIGIRYEPVPRHDEFSELPERFRVGFSRMVVDGVVRDYEAGVEEQLGALYSATVRFRDKLTEFHNYVANPTASNRCVIRDVLLGSVKSKVRVLRGCNVDNSVHVDRFCTQAETFTSYDDLKKHMDFIRQDPAVRANTLTSAGMLCEMLAGYLGVTGEDSQEDA
jgi:hypothetical protein